MTRAEAEAGIKKRYIFTIQISGVGENEQEAWLDATEAFDQDPGVCPNNHTIEEEKE